MYPGIPGKIFFYLVRSMKKMILLLGFAIVFCLGCNESASEVGSTDIIPKPHLISFGEAFFTIDQKSIVGVASVSQEALANLVFSEFEERCGWKPQIVVGGTKADIQFTKNESLPSEGYTMDIGTDRISIEASSDAGFFYALQSLRQMLPISFYSDTAKTTKSWNIPTASIEDQAAFEWRGFMLDVSRHFFTVQQVKQVLDMMASLKLNRFHWHLADDQGWRIEIKQYPKLTEVGAWRVDYNNTDETKSDWWGRPVQKEGDKATYGGFYTQEEIKEIIAYAKARFIDVVPEIDMPGHAQATIAAYPEIGCINAAPYVATGGVFQNNTYNPGKEETFEFAHNMLNEVMDLFPFEYVHIGGDECNKNQWKIDPHAQRRMKEEGLKNEEELQSYFIKRIEKIINARGKVMIGWDEILEGGLAPNAVVMSWRGEEGGIVAAKAGHEVIMTPSKHCYIDLKQGHDDLEPNLGYSRSLLSDAYNYKVIPDSLSAEEGKLIKGIQANLWTESISDWSKLTYMTYPRVFAIAENAWTAEENKDWKGFTDRLQTQFDRLDAENVRYAVSAFSPWIKHEGQENGIRIELTTEADDLDIYYTTDLSEPDTNSLLYQNPFKINDPTTIKARAFSNGRSVGYTSKLRFPIHQAHHRDVRDANGQPLPKLVDLNFARLHPSDKNWSRFKDDFEATIYFEEATEVNEVSFNSLRFTISGIYPPKKVEVWGGSKTGELKLLQEENNLEISLEQGRNKIHHQLSFEPTKVERLMIRAFSHKPLGEGHHRAGQNSTIAIDELVVFRNHEI